jgi:hypothetical protein
MQRPFAKYFLAKRLLATTVLALAVLESAAAGAGELPAFEVSAFPATPVQVSVLGGKGLQEQAATPVLTRNGMPASPHQLSVLTPRPKTVAAAGQSTVGAAQ